MEKNIKQFGEFVNEYYTRGGTPIDKSREKIGHYTIGGIPIYLDDNFIMLDDYTIVRNNEKKSKVYDDAVIANDLVDNYDCDYEQALNYVALWKKIEKAELNTKEYGPNSYLFPKDKK